MNGTVTIDKPDVNFSNKIKALSFLFAIFVIGIHANNLKYYGFEDATYSLPFIAVKLTAEIFGGIAVPFFFMMSGFWFFRIDILERGGVSKASCGADMSRKQKLSFYRIFSGTPLQWCFT